LGLTSNQVRRIIGDDKVLANLYANAAAFIYPSLYEGFGMALLEAMAYQCPIVCSNAGSIPEVAGDAAEYFDPYEVDDIKQAIENVVYSPEKSRTLISRGLIRVNQFSWDKCAQQTYAIYSSLL
jgi:glycosyltransferase involved in cell wall biosynthesis